MPELPEVEIVRRSLEAQILGKEIIDINILYEKIIDGSISEFKKNVIGTKVISMLRFGKFLVFVLDNDYVIVSHLRMEGKYHIRKLTDLVTKHEHVIFIFSNKETLRYEDTRKFGRMELRTKDNYLKTLPLKKLAKEPFDIDETEFYKSIKTKNRTIKQLLLDQTIISGLGNIYVDETLFLSKISPLRKGLDISFNDIVNIKKSAISVLNKALTLGGTTIRTFSATDIHGKFQNELLVHTKKDLPCPICKNPIIKIKVGGRGTYVCTNCQK